MITDAILFSGLTLALLLGFAKKVSQKANLFLGLALIVIVLKTAGVTPLLLPALGPLLFFHVRQLTCPDRRFRGKDLLHFCPLLVGYWMPAWLVLISVIIYLYLSHRLIEDFYRKLQPVLMDRPRFAFRRLDRTLLGLGLCCGLAFFGDPFFLTVALIAIGMAVEALLKPDNGVQLTMPKTDSLDAREKGRRLREVVAANRLYEDAELTLATLAGKLQIHPHELSRIINMGLEKNFSDFINEFRVRDIARKMEDPANDRVTLLGIAYESGFNSKTTFNRVFKEMTGKTPAEYKNSLKKEVPNDKSGLRSRIRPVILRSGSLPYWVSEIPKRNSMIRNYLKIAYRQLRKQKMYAAIKIGGFALGIAACLLIGLYIRDETGHDSTYPDADQIYRVQGNGQFDTGYEWPAPMSKAIENDFAEVAFSGRVQPVWPMELRRADQTQNTYEQGFMYADSSFLNAFQLPMISGDGRTALKEPQTMVIAKTMADKYYPGKNPIGQLMCLDNDKSHPFRISAVMADIPSSSHLHSFNFLLSLAGKEFWPGEYSWSFYNYWVYVKLKPGADPAAFEKKLNAGLINNYLRPQYLKDGGKDPEKELKKIHFHLQPVKDINLYSYDYPDGLPHGDIHFIWLFGAIAAFILVIACINFVNLSTAKSANRAKEVGLRKVMGSYRGSLINQFLTESLIYSFISFVLGIAIAWLLLPYFNGIASKSLVMPLGEWWFVPVMVGSALLVGIFAGLYPAFYLSSFRPVQVLKGSISRGGGKSPLLRNSLVVFQFTASIILIISTIVVYGQMHLILNLKVGFDKDQVMILQSTNTLGDRNIKEFKAELSKIASVKSVSIGDFLPIEGTSRNGTMFAKEGREKLDEKVWSQFWQIDDTYLKTLGIKLVEGRNFSYDMASDTAGQSVIINQTMVKELGLKNPVGARISNGGVFTVIGVVADFNYESLRGRISPMVLHFGLSPSMMTVKFSTGDVKSTVADVSALWKKFSPDQPIRYTFLDEEFANMYADVMRTGRIFTGFSVLGIIIACLGLFALSAFMAEQRSKEIGVRKVLGASVQGITTLLSGDFIKLVLLAILIASPLAWWGMNRWLQDFAYKIPISWWMFASAGLGAILIALITVSFQSVKAALANPVKSLRSE